MTYRNRTSWIATISAAAALAATAHAVHGAICISAEFDLQLLTRRLHAWRLTDDVETYWSNVLGGERIEKASGSIDFSRAEVFLERAN
jgi:acyl-CoA dehydrogenase